MTAETAMIERDVKKQCMLLLSNRGALVQNNSTGTLPTLYGDYIKVGLEGSADIIACWRGRFLAIETKRPNRRGKKGGQQRNQELYEAAVKRAGGIYWLIKNVKELEEKLDELERSL